MKNGSNVITNQMTANAQVISIIMNKHYKLYDKITQGTRICVLELQYDLMVHNLYPIRVRLDFFLSNYYLYNILLQE